MPRIDTSGLSRKNLNLLVLFYTIAETRSVTAAAAHLSLTQSATSHALARLRLLFDDPLFLRRQGRLELTPRAEELLGTVEAFLSTAENLFRQAGFAPEDSAQPFRLGMSQCHLSMLGLATVRQLQEKACRAPVVIEPFSDDTARLVERGSLDLGIWHGDAPPSGVRSQPLMTDRYVGVVDRRHELAARARQGAVGLDEYLRYPHVHASSASMGADPLCQAVRGLKAARQVAVQTRSFLASLGFVEASPFIATVPASVMDDAAATNPDLVSFELPFEVPPVTTGLLPRNETSLSVRDPAILGLRGSTRWHGRITRRSRRSGCCGKPRYG